MLYEEGHNVNIAFELGTNGRGLDVLLEDMVVAHIPGNGVGLDLCMSHVCLDPEDLRQILRKIEEVRKFGNKPSPCEACGGTPYFPNVRPADKVFEEHICSAPMHLNRPR